MIYQNQKINLYLNSADIFDCNLEHKDGFIKFKNKYTTKKDIEINTDCNKKELSQIIQEKTNPVSYDWKKNRFFLMSGLEDTRIDSGNIFRGTVKTQNRFSYDVEINILDKESYGLYLIHGMEFLNFKHSQVSNTQRMKDRSLVKPEFGVQYKTNNNFLNTSIGAVMETHLLAMDYDPDTLIMNEMYSPGVRIGLHMNPWTSSNLELFGSAVTGTTASVESVLTFSTRFSQKILPNFALAFEAHQSKVKGTVVNQTEKGIAGGVTLDF